MKLRSVSYDEEEKIKEVTVAMTLNEIIAIVTFAGKLNGYAHQRLGIDGDNGDLYSCLSNVLQMNFDGDIPELDDFPLGDINKPI